jgi:hypothetical protein
MPRAEKEAKEVAVTQKRALRKDRGKQSNYASCGSNDPPKLKL